MARLCCRIQNEFWGWGGGVKVANFWSRLVWSGVWLTTLHGTE